MDRRGTCTDMVIKASWTLRENAFIAGADWGIFRLSLAPILVAPPEIVKSFTEGKDVETPKVDRAKIQIQGNVCT